jgi:hypothetical protein
MDATRYLCDAFEDKISNGILNFPESTFASYIVNISGGFKLEKNLWIPETPNQIHPSGGNAYVIEEFTAIYLTSLAFQVDEFYDVCAQLCAHNISFWAPLPPTMRTFAEDVLLGNISRPSKRSRPRKKNWLERYYLWSTTLEVGRLFNLKLTKDPDLSDRDSASHAVAEALTVCGRPTTYDEIKRLMVHPDNSRLRKEFNAAERICLRWQTRDVPQFESQNEYVMFWKKTASQDAKDILATFPVD